MTRSPASWNLLARAWLHINKRESHRRGMVPSKDNRTKRYLFRQMIMTPGCLSPLFNFASQAIGPVAVVAVGLWIAWATLLFELSTQSTASPCRLIFLNEWLCD